MSMHEKGDIPRGKIFDSWRLAILSREEFYALGNDDTSLSKEQCSYLSSFGLLAPTTHNTVPQKMQIISSSEMKLSFDNSYILPASDPRGRQAWISLGCVVENISIAALYYGWEGNFILNKTSSNSPLSGGGLRFLQTEKTISNSWLQAMLERKSVRSEYNSQEKLSSELISTLTTTISEKYPSLQFHLLTEKQHIHELAKYEEMAMRTVIEQQSFANELGEWLFPNADGTHERGMRGREFGFDDPLSQRMHDGLLGKERLLPDELAAFAIGGKLYMNSSSAIGIISISPDSDEQRCTAGRALEHLWLLLQQQGYSVAIHASTTEVERVNRMLRVLLKTTYRPTVVFRIGKPLKKEDTHRPHSSRPGIETIVS